MAIFSVPGPLPECPHSSASVPFRRRFLLAAGCTAFGALSTPVFSQSGNYPNHPVRVVIPFPPGGPTDIVGRVLSTRLGDAWGQSVVVDNRSGASGVIGADVVARAAADGYTLLVNVSAHVINPALYDKLPHDPIKDFTPITNLAQTPMQLIVAADLPVRSVDELIAYVKAKPGVCSFAASSNGAPGHLAGELFRKMTKLELAYVPYKGSAPALTDVLGGQVTYMFDSMPSSAALVKSGKLRALGVTSAKRVSTLPDVPTMREGGLDLTLNSWYGLWAPADTSNAVVQEIYTEAARAFSTPEVRARLADIHSEAVLDSPADFAVFCRSEAERYRQIIRTAGIVIG